MHLTRGALTLAAVAALASCAATPASGPAQSGPRDDIVLAGAATAQEAPVTGTGSTPTPAASSSHLGARSAASAASSTSAGPGLGGAASSAPRTPTATVTAGPTSASAAGPCLLQRPAGAGAARVDLAGSGLACAPATALLTAYLAAVDDGTHGNTKALVVNGWVCQSPTASESQASGVVAVCAQNGATLTARPAPVS